MQKIPSIPLNPKPSIITKEVGKNVLAIFNNPQRLNAITVPVILDFFNLLSRFEKEKSLLIITGAGDKALSSGADLLVLQEEYLKNKKYIEDLMLYYNRNIYLLSKYKIQAVAIMNGITFGGGAGYAMCAKYRIATEKTNFAMPEIKVAFHPNASGTIFLNSLPGQLGIYLGLTGNSLFGSDVVRVRLATHFCNSIKLKKLEDELLNSSSEIDFRDIIDGMCEKQIPEFSLSGVMENINKCFSESTVEGIISKLKQDNSSWAQETLNILNRHSPMALKLVLTQLRQGKHMKFKDCLFMETSLSINCFKYPDIFEGIRILVQKKKEKPKWNPSKLSEVTEDMINTFFTPVAEDLLRSLLKDVDERNV